ncbi:MAG: 3-phosphoshikimate 1-carboxyvinyltransferase [Lachnospiraceae bacterium]|nr:3-phosphoshikimate 1-carboxyvinyltransferase [Lachnospiraceae bacterium]
MEFQKVKGLKGEITIPGDKSISHRAIMIGSLADGPTEITNFLEGADCLSTITCFQKMGIKIIKDNDKITVRGKTLDGLSTPCEVLDTGNSGTTTRLISGILAAQPFSSVLTGDASIQRRPMKRIMEPLNQMGASISSVMENDCVPLHIKGSDLTGIHYKTKVASAQVKSAILLAGLYADGKTSVTEPTLSRNHTEIMLRYFGAKVDVKDTTVTVYPRPHLYGQKIVVPGDISSAAYFIAAASIVPNSEILIKNVGINPTRAGILEVARDMGANITLCDKNEDNGEPVADLLVKSSTLHGTTIEGDLIPTLIDEIPILAIMAAYADGKTVIKDAAELKVKESNRIETVVNNLKNMGADIEATKDGMIIRGGKALKGAKIDSCMDHRIAMSFAIAALNATGKTDIKDAECVNISYPNFYSDLKALQN